MYVTGLTCYDVTSRADYFSARNAEPGPGLKRSVPALNEQEGWMFTGFSKKECYLLIVISYSTTTTTYFTIYVTDDYTSQ